MTTCDRHDRVYYGPLPCPYCIAHDLAAAVESISRTPEVEPYEGAAEARRYVAGVRKRLAPDAEPPRAAAPAPVSSTADDVVCACAECAAARSLLEKHRSAK